MKVYVTYSMYINVYGNKVKFDIDIIIDDLENSIMRIRYSLLNSFGTIEFIPFSNRFFEPYF